MKMLPSGPPGAFADKIATMTSYMKNFKHKQSDMDEKQMNVSGGHNPATKRGWLKKQGGMIRTWHNRYFVLSGDFLFYYKEEDDLKAIGTIMLPGNRVIQHPLSLDDPEKFTFEIVPGGKGQPKPPTSETFIMCAASDAERQDWIKAIRKVMFASIGGAIFGQKLADTMKYEHKRDERTRIPYIVQQCIDFLEKNGTETEGIFRLPGRSVLVRELKEKFDCGERLILDNCEADIHSVASLLKQYFRELPESIIPYDKYQHYMNIAMRFQAKQEKDSKLEEVTALQEEMPNVPKDNYEVLKHLCKFLHTVASKENINRMSALNLAMVFGPNIIRHPNMDDNPELFMMTTADLSQQLAFMFINYSDQIFTMEYDNPAVSNAVAVDELLNLNEEEDGGSAEFVLKPSRIKSSIIRDLNGLDFSTNNVQPALSEENIEFFMSGESTPDTLSPTVEKRNSTSQGCKPSLPSKPGFAPDGRPIPPARPSRKKTKRFGHVYEKENGPKSPGSDDTSSQGSSIVDEDFRNETNNIPYMDDHDNTDGGALDKPNSPTEKVKDQDLERSASLPIDYSVVKDRIEPSPEEVSELKQKLSHSQGELNTFKTKHEELVRTKSRSDASVKKLMSEMTKLRTYYEDHIKNMEERHQKQMKDLVEKLNEEKNSKAEAIEKVINLQNELHQYQMTYGDIKMRSDS